MARLSAVFVVAFFFVVVSLVVVGGTDCSGTPKMLNGKYCASTTRYWDGQEGACGCGSSSGPDSWSYTNYSAAGSPYLFGGTSTWCGSGCGKCYELTPTGYSPTGGNGCGSKCSTSIVVMVTNLCPYTSPNTQWCVPSGQDNSYGYNAHFDLMDQNMNGVITALGWNNPEVVYQEVSCPSNLSTDYHQCDCY